MNKISEVMMHRSLSPSYDLPIVHHVGGAGHRHEKSEDKECVHVGCVCSEDLMVVIAPATAYIPKVNLSCALFKATNPSTIVILHVRLVPAITTAHKLL